MNRNSRYSQIRQYTYNYNNDMQCPGNHYGPGDWMYFYGLFPFHHGFSLEKTSLQGLEICKLFQRLLPLTFLEKKHSEKVTVLTFWQKKQTEKSLPEPFWRRNTPKQSCSRLFLGKNTQKRSCAGLVWRKNTFIGLVRDIFGEETLRKALSGTFFEKIQRLETTCVFLLRYLAEMRLGLVLLAKGTPVVKVTRCNLLTL